MVLNVGNVGVEGRIGVEGEDKREALRSVKCVEVNNNTNNTDTLSPA